MSPFGLHPGFAKTAKSAKMHGGKKCVCAPKGAFGPNSTKTAHLGGPGYNISSTRSFKRVGPFKDLCGTHMTPLMFRSGSLIWRRLQMLLLSTRVIFRWQHRSKSVCCEKRWSYRNRQSLSIGMWVCPNTRDAVNKLMCFLWLFLSVWHRTSTNAPFVRTSRKPDEEP